MKTFNQFNESKFSVGPYANKKPKRSKEEFVGDFRDTITKDSIIDWVMYDLDENISPIIDDWKDTRIFKKRYGDKLKNFIKLEKTENEIYQLDKKLKELEKEKEKISIDADYEYMYYFQKEMIEKDFDTFYKMFIEEEERNFKIDQANNPDADMSQEATLYDVHPKIRNTEEFLDKLDMYKETKKYNL